MSSPRRSAGCVLPFAAFSLSFTMMVQASLSVTWWARSSRGLACLTCRFGISNAMISWSLIPTAAGTLSSTPEASRCGILAESPPGAISASGNVRRAKGAPISFQPLRASRRCAPCLTLLRSAHDRPAPLWRHLRPRPQSVSVSAKRICRRPLTLTLIGSLSATLVLKSSSGAHSS